MDVKQKKALLRGQDLGCKCVNGVAWAGSAVRASFRFCDPCYGEDCDDTSYEEEGLFRCR